ncbi:Uncharacterised protein [Mycobacterium tuberculosis]|nr:Uncharacterised protein [Mycobacterium tuberculosis]
MRVAAAVRAGTGDPGPAGGQHGQRVPDGLGLVGAAVRTVPGQQPRLGPHRAAARVVAVAGIAGRTGRGTHRDQRDRLGAEQRPQPPRRLARRVVGQPGPQRLRRPREQVQGRERRLLGRVARDPGGVQAAGRQGRPPAQRPESGGGTGGRGVHHGIGDGR